jgi:hypothetical protein
LKKIAIIGSHGLYANYGGWDQLVNNLAEKKSGDIEYLIFNSRDTPTSEVNLSNVVVKKSIFKAAGFEGLLFDFLSIITCFFKVDTILFLGVQGLPILPFLLLFKNIKIVCNSGGIEWERTKFGYLAKLYLRLCFKLSLKYSSHVILDNEFFRKYLPSDINYESKVHVIPYGGVIDESLSINYQLLDNYSFLDKKYYLSISRSIADNMIDELCKSFINSEKSLVLISNLSSSNYGKNILKNYSYHKNIFLIDGLYEKPVLDLIRRKCKAYIHTHTSCGTAPSLVEMAISKRPILSIDKPQNRFTLENEGFYFKSFEKLIDTIDSISNFDKYIISKKVRSIYSWPKIVSSYENLY